MRRSGFLLALLALATSRTSAVAFDLEISVQTQSISTSGSTGTFTENVYVTSNAMGGDNLNIASFQLDLTPSAGNNNRSPELMFTPTANQETFGQFAASSSYSNYVFNGYSFYTQTSPTLATGESSDGASGNNTVFLGGDFYNDPNAPPATSGNGDVLVGSTPLLLGQFTMTYANNLLRPGESASYSISLDTGNSSFYSSDDMGNLSSVSFGGTSGIITLISPSVVPLPASCLMMGSGLGLMAARTLRRRSGR